MKLNQGILNLGNLDSCRGGYFRVSGDTQDSPAPGLNMDETKQSLDMFDLHANTKTRLSCKSHHIPQAPEPPRLRPQWCEPLGFPALDDWR